MALMVSSAHQVVLDVTIDFNPPGPAPAVYESGPHKWHRLQKELSLHKDSRRAWLCLALAEEEDLVVGESVVTDIRVGDTRPNFTSGSVWESRPCGLWVLRRPHNGDVEQTVTAVDVLFGADAVDPRPQWTLLQSPLELREHPQEPVARLSVLCGRMRPSSIARPVLRAGEDGYFKIVQLSDTHMIAGVGVCTDAIDAERKHLPETQADPLTVRLIEDILDVEKPDLVVLTGDQVHHDTLDTQTALFKVVAPIIKRSIPFAAVFGNHDSEGALALPRKYYSFESYVLSAGANYALGAAQMALLQDLPFSLCEPGPVEVDGVGNFCLDILAPDPSSLPLSSLYFLDSHGQIPSWIRNPDYDTIKRSQIDWLINSSRARRAVREKDEGAGRSPISLVFQHIPLPEFRMTRRGVRGGHWREPPECPSVNSHLYDALVRENVSAFACGHDHVNDFCALLPQKPKDGNHILSPGPWLCYAGACGFGGYCSYDGRRFHRRARVWLINPSTASLTTWKRVQHQGDRVDELVLVQDGAIPHGPREVPKPRSCVMS